MNGSNKGLPRRILIYGVTGSGKSHLARRISERCGIPYHCVDDLTWDPGWVQVPNEEQQRRIEAICCTPEWILDSAYSRWVRVPLESADLIVGLDFHRAVSMARLLRRTWQRVADRQPVCNGNFESLRITLSRDSIILWHFKSFKRKRERIRLWERELPDRKVLRFTRPKQVERWLESLGS